MFKNFGPEELKRCSIGYIVSCQLSNSYNAMAFLIMTYNLGIQSRLQINSLIKSSSTDT